MTEPTEQALDELRARGALQFDPVGFSFLEALTRRRLQQDDAVRALLEQRLAQALADLQARLTQAEAESATLVGELAARFPEAAAELQRRLNAHDFKGIAHCQQRLSRSQPTASLASLIQALQEGVVEALEVDEGRGDSLEDRLRQQEQEALQAHAGVTTPPSGGPQGPGELKALRLVRERLSQQSTAQRLTQALGSAPEDAGPLNAHKLVVRSLNTMQALSPAYLNRFLEYIDSLLWLEQAASLREKGKEKGSD